MFWKKSKLLIIYSTVDGHTKNICEYINKKLKNKKIISIASLEDALKFNLDQFDEIVIGDDGKTTAIIVNIKKDIEIKDFTDKSKKEVEAYKDLLKKQKDYKHCFIGGCSKIQFREV